MWGGISLGIGAHGLAGRFSTMTIIKQLSHRAYFKFKQRVSIHYDAVNFMKTNFSHRVLVALILALASSAVLANPPIPDPNTGMPPTGFL